MWEFITAIWGWVLENKETLAVVVGFITIFWAAVQYIVNKTIETRVIRFDQYHWLISELVEEDSSGATLDRQIAVTYELRGFCKYYEATKRILEGLQSDRAELGISHPRLDDEINRTLVHVNKGLQCKECCRTFRNAVLLYIGIIIFANFIIALLPTALL